MKALFAAPAMKIATGAILALLIALGAVWWLYRSESASHDDTRDVLAMERAQHAVTRQSVDTLSNEMKRLVAEGEARKERIDAAMAKVAKDTAPLRAEAERIEREGLGEDYAGRLREVGL